MKILGLDISTTTIGLTLLSTDPKVKIDQMEYFKPPKDGHIAERLLTVKNHIISKIKAWQPDLVVVEDILLGAGKGTTIKTLAGLAIFNRTVCLAALEATGKAPELLNVLKIRHCLKMDKVLPSKQEMPELLAKHLGITWDFLLTKKGKVMPENFDMADSVAVALAYHKISTQPAKKKVNKDGSQASKKNSGSKRK